MKVKTKLIFIRHGETEWNAAGRFQGQLDSNLSERGQKQAAMLGEAMRNFSFSHLYSSDLGRAYSTAKAIADVSGHEIVTDKRLRERGYGIFQGLTSAEIAEKHPDIYREYKYRENDYVVPGGESAEEILNRTLECMDDLLTRHRGGAYAVIAHGGIINRFFRNVIGLSQFYPRRFDIKNASINIFVHNGEFWKVDALGIEPALLVKQ